MIVDANMHWLPENLFSDKSLRDSFINCVPCAYGEYAKICTIPGTKLQQIVIEKPQGYENLNYAENQYDIQTQLKDMDEAGVKTAILRIPCWQEWLTLDMCKIVNNALAEHVKRYPGRFLALAVCPPWGTRECLKEVKRCIEELGFSGVQLAAHYGKLYLDEAEFRPYFKELNRLGVPVVVHHTPLPVEYGSLIKYTNLRRQYGRCVDQATAVGRELFSGMFEEFPNLKFIHSMLGGGFFAYANMLAPRKAGVKEEVERFDIADKVRNYLERNIYFDISGASQWGKDQLECAVKVLGADHILYGSSYPIRREWFAKGVEFVQSLQISQAEKSLILGKNAEKLFNIKDKKHAR
jgi:predicted TIM-barrel fold metal-dependent hydrolase